MALHNLYDINDFLGKRFGRLTVISKADPIKEGSRVVLVVVVWQEIMQAKDY